MSAEYEDPSDNEEKSMSVVKLDNLSDHSGGKLREDEEDNFVGPEKEYKVKDIPAIIVFLLILVGLFYIGVYSLKTGDPTRYLDGYDSWGNICGRKENILIPGLIPDLTGKDLSANKYAFHMGLIEFENVVNPIKYFYQKHKSAVICVKECPQNITNCKELLRKSGYTHIPQDYVDEYICVSSPGIILTHTPVLSRCVPAQIVRVSNVNFLSN